MKRDIAYLLICMMIVFFAVGCAPGNLPTEENSMIPANGSAEPSDQTGWEEPDAMGAPVQPISFHTVDQVIDFLEKGDLQGYRDEEREKYAEMVSVIQKANKLPVLSYPEDTMGEFWIEKVLLLPKAQYEDIGISFRIYYKEKFYYIAFYFMEDDYRETAVKNGIAAYDEKRFGITPASNGEEIQLEYQENKLDAIAGKTNIKFVCDETFIVWARITEDAENTCDVLKGLSVEYKKIS